VSLHFTRSAEVRAQHGHKQNSRKARRGEGSPECLQENRIDGGTSPSSPRFIDSQEACLACWRSSLPSALPLGSAEGDAMGRPATPPGMTRKEMFVENRLAAQIKEFKKQHPGYPRDTYDFLLREGLRACGVPGVKDQPIQRSGPERQLAYALACETMTRYFGSSSGRYMRALGELCGEKLRYWNWGEWRKAGQVPSAYVPVVQGLAMLLPFLAKIGLLTPEGLKD